MKYFLQTRSKFQDYSFVGCPPDDQWWLKFKDFVVFEKPGFLLDSTEKELKLYVWRIPSGRKDRVGSGIFSSFVFQASKAEVEKQKHAIAFLKKFVKSLIKNDFKDLENSIVQYFPEDLIEDSWFKSSGKKELEPSEISRENSSKADSTVVEEVENAVKKFIESFADFQTSGLAKFNQNYWICGLKSSDLSQDKLFSVLDDVLLSDKKELYGFFNAVLSEKGKRKLIEHFQGANLQKIGVIINSEDLIESFEISKKVAPLAPQNSAEKSGEDQKKSPIHENIRIAAKIICLIGFIIIFAILAILIIAKMTNKSEISGESKKAIATPSSSAPSAESKPVSNSDSKSKSEKADTPSNSENIGNIGNGVASSTRPLIDSDPTRFLGKAKEFFKWFIQSLGWPLIKKIFTALYSQF